MDFDRDWTLFAVDAEVEHCGVSRIVKAHNSLRAKYAELKAKVGIEQDESGGAVLTDAANGECRCDENESPSDDCRRPCAARIAKTALNEMHEIRVAAEQAIRQQGGEK